VTILWLILLSVTNLFLAGRGVVPLFSDVLFQDVVRVSNARGEEPQMGEEQQGGEETNGVNVRRGEETDLGLKDIKKSVQNSNI